MGGGRRWCKLRYCTFACGAGIAILLGKHAARQGRSAGDQRCASSHLASLSYSARLPCMTKLNGGVCGRRRQASSGFVRCLLSLSTDCGASAVDVQRQRAALVQGVAHTMSEAESRVRVFAVQSFSSASQSACGIDIGLELPCCGMGTTINAFARDLRARINDGTLNKQLAAKGPALSATLRAGPVPVTAAGLPIAFGAADEAGGILLAALLFPAALLLPLLVFVLFHFQLIERYTLWYENKYGDESSVDPRIFSADFDFRNQLFGGGDALEDGAEEPGFGPQIGLGTGSLFARNVDPVPGRDRKDESVVGAPDIASNAGGSKVEGVGSTRTLLPERVERGDPTQSGSRIFLGMDDGRPLPHGRDASDSPSNLRDFRGADPGPPGAIWVDATVGTEKVLASRFAEGREHTTPTHSVGVSAGTTSNGAAHACPASALEQLQASRDWAPVSPHDADSRLAQCSPRRAGAFPPAEHGAKQMLETDCNPGSAQDTGVVLNIPPECRGRISEVAAAVPAGGAGGRGELGERGHGLGAVHGVTSEATMWPSDRFAATAQMRAEMEQLPRLVPGEQPGERRQFGWDESPMAQLHLRDAARLRAQLEDMRRSHGAPHLPGLIGRGIISPTPRAESESSSDSAQGVANQGVVAAPPQDDATPHAPLSSSARSAKMQAARGGSSAKQMPTTQFSRRRAGSGSTPKIGSADVDGTRRKSIMDLHKEMFRSRDNMTTMERLPGDKDFSHYHGMGSLAGRMQENAKDSLPQRAMRPGEPAQPCGDEDEMWG